MVRESRRSDDARGGDEMVSRGAGASGGAGEGVLPGLGTAEEWVRRRF